MQIVLVGLGASIGAAHPRAGQFPSWLWFHITGRVMGIAEPKNPVNLESKHYRLVAWPLFASSEEYLAFPVSQVEDELFCQRVR